MVSRMFHGCFASFAYGVARVSRVGRTIVVHDVGGGLRVLTAPLVAKTAFSRSESKLAENEVKWVLIIL